MQINRTIHRKRFILILVIIPLLSFHTITKAKCNSLYINHPQDTFAFNKTLTIDQLASMESAQIAKYLTDKLNRTLIFTDKQYKKAYKSLYKEATLIKANTDTLIIKGAQAERDDKMKQSLKEYQYQLYKNIKDSLYRFK